MKIDIKALKPGIHEYEWEVEAGELELDPEIFRDMQVDARLDFQPAQIFVTLHTFASAKLTCDRTLVAFDQVVEGEHSVLFSGAALMEGQEESDAVRLLRADDEEIDISDVVRDTFLLSLPQRRIAPGADAEEIPLTFGTPDSGGATIDPRWEALRKLSSQGDTSKEVE